MDVLNEEQTRDLNNLQKQKSFVKSQRVSDYLGSNGVKSNILTYSNDNILPDKITNSSIQKLKNADETPKKYIKNFRHVYDDKRVYYD